jgi:hypothetical protein
MVKIIFTFQLHKNAWNLSLSLSLWCIHYKTCLSNLIAIFHSGTHNVCIVHKHVHINCNFNIIFTWYKIWSYNKIWDKIIINCTMNIHVSMSMWLLKLFKCMLTRGKFTSSCTVSSISDTDKCKHNLTQSPAQSYRSLLSQWLMSRLNKHMSNKNLRIDWLIIYGFTSRSRIFHLNMETSPLPVKGCKI